MKPSFKQFDYIMYEDVSDKVEKHIQWEGAFAENVDF